MTLTPNLLSFCELTLFSSCVGRSFTSTNCFSCHLYFLLGLLHVSVEPTINSGFIFFFLRVKTDQSYWLFTLLEQQTILCLRTGLHCYLCANC